MQKYYDYDMIQQFQVEFAKLIDKLGLSDDILDKLNQKLMELDDIWSEGVIK